MKTKAECQKRAGEIPNEIAAIFAKADSEKRATTPDELKAVTALEDEAAQVDARLAEIAEEEKARERNAIRIKSLSESAGRKATQEQPGGAVRHDEHGRVTATFEETDEVVSFRVGESPDAQTRLSYREQKRENARLLKSQGYKPWANRQGGASSGFGSFREFVRAGFDGHQHSAFREQHRAHFAAVKGMSEGSGSDGGYLVMPEFASGIIDRVYDNDLWGRTDNYSVTGNNMTFLANAETSRANGSRAGGMRGYWLAEGASLTASKPTLREVTLKLVKLGVLVYLTNELIEDAGDALQRYVGRKAADEFNFMLGDSLFNGTGVGQPLGMLNSPSLVSVAKESGQLAATIATENIVKMDARFFAPNKPGARWYHNQDIQPELDLMTLGIGASGLATYMPPGGLSGSRYATLRGLPAQATEFNATLGTQGDIVLADLGQMLSISKGGIAQAVSMHVEFLTDQMALRFIMRCNAGPWENAALTPYKGTATQSSFVTLDTRA